MAQQPVQRGGNTHTHTLTHTFNSYTMRVSLTLIPPEEYIITHNNKSNVLCDSSTDVNCACVFVAGDHPLP